MLLAVAHQLTGVKQKRDFVENPHQKVFDEGKFAQFPLVFGPNSLYLTNPELLITEIEHSIKEYHHNPKQGVFLLQLATVVGQRLIDLLIEVHCMSSKEACKKQSELRELSGACCNILNYIITAADNATIYSRKLAWAPEETIENIRSLKNHAFSLFGCLSKFVDEPAKIDWYGFSAFASCITSSFEHVRRDSEKQKARMTFYLGVKAERR